MPRPSTFTKVVLVIVAVMFVGFAVAAVLSSYGGGHSTPSVRTTTAH